MDPALADRLAQIPLFAELDPDHLRSVTALVEEFEVPAGYILVQPGLVGSGMFLLEEGTATLSLHNREISLGPGEVIGELALLSGAGVHTTRVRTSSAVKGYCISRDAFDQLIHDEPKIAVALLKVIARRLVEEISTH
jgi:CRP-like cAMP-binding protein